MTVILFAWAATFAGSVPLLILKAFSKTYLDNSWLNNIYWAGARIPFLVPFALLIGGGMPTNWSPILWLAAISALELGLITKALKSADLTTLGSLFNLKILFTIGLGIVFLDETLTLLELLFALVLLAASPFAAFSAQMKVKAFLDPVVLLFVFVTFLEAIQAYLINVSIDQNGFATTLLWHYPLLVLLFIPTLYFVPREKLNLTKGHLLPILGLGFSAALFSIFSFFAYGDNIILTSIILSLPVTIFAVLYLEKRFPGSFEQNPRWIYKVRIPAALVMFVCATWLSLT